MADPFKNPYEDDQRSTGGAQLNGQRGADTFVSSANAGTQQKTGGDPYAAFGNLGSAWAQHSALNKLMQKPEAPAQTQNVPMYEYAMSDQGGELGGDVETSPSPWQPAPQIEPPPSPPQPQTETPPPAPPPHPQFTPQTDPDPTRTQARQKPPNVSDGTWDTAQRWVQQAAEKGGNYGWLLDKPEVIDQYTQEATDLESLGVTGLHFTDWARARGYDSSIDSGTLKAPEAFKHVGGDDHTYETMVRWLADGSSKYGAGAMKAYADQLQRAPGLISSYENEMQQAEQAGFTGIHFVDWLANQQGGFHSPLAGQMGQESADAAARWAGHASTGQEPLWPGGPPPPPPGFVPPPGTLGGPPLPPYAAQPPAPQTPPGGPPVAQPPMVPPHVDQVLRPGGPGRPPSPYPPDFDATTLRAANVDYLDPAYKDAMDEVRRQMMQAGAVSGSLDSGGFGATLAHQLAPIANQFAQQKGQLQFQAQQENANRLLDKYKFDNGQDLAKFLAANKDELDRYGIDQNTVLTQWVQNNKAQLEREGYDLQKVLAQMQAEAGISAASINASAAHAGAGAAADAARYNADLDYKLGREQVDYNYWNSDAARQSEDQFNQRGYDLGVLGINRDIYGMDQTQLRYLMGLMNSQSPDARLSQPNLPGMFPYGG